MFDFAGVLLPTLGIVLIFFGVRLSGHVPLYLLVVSRVQGVCESQLRHADARITTTGNVANVFTSGRLPA